MAFPIASWLLAYRLTFRLGCLAMSNAVRLLADCHTFWAIEHFASFIWAFNFALGFFTFYVADGVLRLRAGGVTLGGFTYRIANGGAVRVITFP